MACDLSGTDFEFLRRRLARGEVVLFLGAGFSVDARNHTGEALPLGGKLAEMLANKAAFPFNGEPLTNVYQAVLPKIGENELWRYLPEIFHVSTYADWYDLIPKFVWHRVYTINIDNLLEVVYGKNSGQTLQKVVCPAHPVERDPHFDKLQLVHLHGHVDHREKGIIFSLAEFAQQTAGPNPWYQQLVDDLFNRPILFVGTPMLEPMLYHYIESRGLSGKYSEIRPQSYIVDPFIGPINAKAFQERNICSVECSAGEFFQALAASVDMSEHSIGAVRSTVFPHISFARSKGIANADVERYFDLIVPHAYPPSPVMPPGAFFMGGEPTWKDIEKRHDGEREVIAELRAAAITPTAAQKMIVIHGPAGSGKSTTLMRFAAEIAGSGDVVYYASQEERLDLFPLLQMIRSRFVGGDTTRVYIFIDVLSRHIGSLDSLRQTIESPLPITFVFADRDNGYFNKCQGLQVYSPIEVKMPDLCEQDVRSILERLETFGFLGALREKTKEQRTKAFMDAAEKQLLVAMRRVPLLDRPRASSAFPGSMTINPLSSSTGNLTESFQQFRRQRCQSRQNRVERLVGQHVVSGTRPLPVDGPLAQTPTDRIGMNIVHGQYDRTRLEEVAIITRTFLPEPKCLHSGPLANRQPCYQMTGPVPQFALDSPGKRPLDGRQQRCHPTGFLTRLDEQVDVFGHHDECEQAVAMSTDGSVNGLTEPCSPEIVRQQRHPPIAGKRQFMHMPRLFEVSHPLSVWWSHGLHVCFPTGWMEGRAPPIRSRELFIRSH